MKSTVPDRSFLEFPDHRDNDDRNNEAENIERDTGFREVGESITSSSVNVGVGLITNRRCKAGRGCDGDREKEGTHTNAEGFGYSDCEGGHEDCGSVIGKRFG
mgnify:CR=1 FL=1